ncbi:MAG: Fic family protein [Bulleidia sp.]
MKKVMSSMEKGLESTKTMIALPADPEDIITRTVHAHNDIERIHLFADGNSRVGRVLANDLLLIYDLLPIIIEHCLSPYRVSDSVPFV